MMRSVGAAPCMRGEQQHTAAEMHWPCAGTGCTVPEHRQVPWASAQVSGACMLAVAWSTWSSQLLSQRCGPLQGGQVLPQRGLWGADHPAAAHGTPADHGNTPSFCRALVQGLPALPSTPVLTHDVLHASLLHMTRCVAHMRAQPVICICLCTSSLAPSPSRLRKTGTGCQPVGSATNLSPSQLPNSTGAGVDGAGCGFGHPGGIHNPAAPGLVLGGGDSPAEQPDLGGGVHGHGPGFCRRSGRAEV